MRDDDARAFYDRLSADYHLVLADWKRATLRQGAVLDRLIRSERGGAGPAEVLDCACGIGTQALGLAALGHRVTASDLSPAAVARARHEAARRGLRLAFAVADMRELGDAVPGTFDVVLAADNALPHLLSEAELCRAARAMAAKLRPGGLLLVSIRDYDEALSTPPTATEPVCAADEGGRRRIVHQVWEWLDERQYRVHLYITRETGSGRLALRPSRRPLPRATPRRAGRVPARGRAGRRALADAGRERLLPADRRRAPATLLRAGVKGTAACGYAPTARGSGIPTPRATPVRMSFAPTDGLGAS